MDIFRATWPYHRASDYVVCFCVWLVPHQHNRSYAILAAYGMTKSAGDKTRTCNIQFGRLSLYRLSYTREIGCSPSGFHSTGYPDRDMQDSSEHLKVRVEGFEPPSQSDYSIRWHSLEGCSVTLPLKMDGAGIEPASLGLQPSADGTSLAHRPWKVGKCGIDPPPIKGFDLQSNCKSHLLYLPEKVGC